IRDFHVTGVQTCALPISPLPPGTEPLAKGRDRPDGAGEKPPCPLPPDLPGQVVHRPDPTLLIQPVIPKRVLPHRPQDGGLREPRSEERRVGKAWRAGGAR